MLSTIVLLTLAAADSTSASYDCAKASGEVEERICQSAELASLDRRLAELYPQVLAALPAAEHAQFKAEQRGWIKGRNECWQADAVEHCITLSYQSRIVALQIAGGLLAAPSAIGWRCQEQPQTPVFAAFYQQTQPPTAVLTVGDDQALLFQEVSGSGTRYATEGVVLREHHGEATIDWYGTALSCQRQ